MSVAEYEERFKFHARIFIGPAMVSIQGGHERAKPIDSGLNLRLRRLSISTLVQM
jgi:hypothetical protein